MRPKVIIKAYDGTNTEAVNQINVPAGAVDPNNVLDLGQGVKVYRALLTQTSTDAPTATVLENTLGGTVVWSYTDIGVYNGLLTGVFTANKTVCTIGSNLELTGSAFGYASIRRSDADTVRINTINVDVDTPSDDLANGLLTNTYVEVLVYPS